MNPITEFISTISDEDLIITVTEMKIFTDSGMLPRGNLTKFSRELSDKFNIPYADASNLMFDGVLKRAAFNYAGLRYE